MKGLKSAYISCDMKRSLRRRIIKEFRNQNIDIIYNYGILSTGFDSPKINTVIIARPTNSIVLYSQMIGRGLRGTSLGGTEICNLIDIKDNFTNFGSIDHVYKYFEGYWK
jgi:superfamily II DNA or RNA helicase